MKGGGYTRPLKGKNIRKLHDRYKDKTGNISYTVYENLEINPIGTVGYGFIEEKPEWILDDCNSVAEKRIAKEGIRNEKIIYAGFMRYQWGHFIVNSMSRLWFIYKYPEEKYDKIIFSVLPGDRRELSGNFLEFFKLLGILDKVEFIECPTAFKTVIVPELSWSLQHHYSEEFNLVYDRLIENVLSHNEDNTVQYPSKVYFTRSQLKTAHLSEIGMEFLDDFFASNGFSVIPPESLSLEQMVMTMQSAEVVAGASGSTVHNILFGKKGQKLIICERNSICNDFQPGLNLARHVDAIFIDSSLTINSVNSGLGPFFYYPTKQLIQFAADNHMSLPSEKFQGKDWIKNRLQRYFRTWSKFYHRQWYFQKCNLPEIDAFYEAYSDSLSVTQEYLNGSKELFWYDWLSPTHIIKKYFGKTAIKFLRRIIRR
jgi:hypothetical protein